MSDFNVVAREFREEVGSDEASRRRHKLIARLQDMISNCKGEESIDDADVLITLRSIIACSYLSFNGEQFHHNGVIIPIDHHAIELAVATNIEGAFYEEYGGEIGLQRALSMLRMMTSYLNEDGETRFGMTNFGLQMMDKLMESLCDMARDAIDQAGCVTTESMGMGVMQ